MEHLTIEILLYNMTLWYVIQKLITTSKLTLYTYTCYNELNQTSIFQNNNYLC